MDEIELRERLAHIGQMLERNDRRLAPWQMAVAGMTWGAALFAAGAAFVTLLHH